MYVQRKAAVFPVCMFHVKQSSNMRDTALPRCEIAFFSSAVISAKVRDWPVGWNIGS